MSWNGDKVTQELNINVPGDEGKHLFGMAYRNNPKRAHLLVSTVLGKHIPQSPKVIQNAMAELSRQIRELLPSQGKITAFGYAETAVAMGATIAEQIGADYLHSTRYPRVGTEYGAFSEDHSHAANHSIHLTDHSLLNDPTRSIVLIDDELSTGNTIINTIESLEQQAHHEHYIVATLTDMRTAKHKEQLRSFAQENSTYIDVVSLLQLNLEVPADSVEKAVKYIKNLNGGTQPCQPKRGEIKTMVKTLPRTPLHGGISEKALKSLGREAVSIGEELLPSLKPGKTLVLGVEEEMYLPLKIAEGLENLGREIVFSSSTLSPVLPHDDSDYAIRSSLTYHIPGHDKPRYAYNINQDIYGNIILVTAGEETTGELKQLIAQLAPLTENLIALSLEGEER